MNLVAGSTQHVRDVLVGSSGSTNSINTNRKLSTVTKFEILDDLEGGNLSVEIRDGRRLQQTFSIRATTITTLQLADYPEFNNSGSNLYTAATTLLATSLEDGSFTSSFVNISLTLNSNVTDADTVVVGSDSVVSPPTFLFPDPADEDNGLTDGEIAGIILSVFFAFLAIVFIVFQLLTRRKPAGAFDEDIWFDPLFDTAYDRPGDGVVGEWTFDDIYRSSDFYPRPLHDFVPSEDFGPLAAFGGAALWDSFPERDQEPDEDNRVVQVVIDDLDE